MFLNGTSKKDIARIEGISYPTIRTILKENDIEGIQEQKETRSKLVEKTLTEIFTYKNKSEESVIDLIFNLRRIANKSGKEDLGDFIESIEFIFDQYYKYSSNPIKLFDIFLDISSNMAFLEDGYNIEEFTKIFEDFYDKCIFIKDADEYLAESKAEREDITAELKKMWNDFLLKIGNEKKKLISEVESKSETLLKNSKQDLKEYREKIDCAKKELSKLASTRTLIIEGLKRMETENQNLKQTLVQTDKENSMLKEMIERVNQEAPIILREMEQVKQENISLKKQLNNNPVEMGKKETVENEKL